MIVRFFVRNHQKVPPPYQCMLSPNSFQLISDTNPVTEQVNKHLTTHNMKSHPEVSIFKIVPKCNGQE